jgi:phospholipid-translocating ATPase
LTSASIHSFFAAIAILQFFPQFSTISPGLVILPIIVILVITAAKDGYEDIKRHQSDRRINYAQVRALHGGSWQNPNAMKSKGRKLSFEFVVRWWQSRQQRKSAGKVAPDVGLIESGVPPEARNTTADQQSLEGPTIEYDYEHGRHSSHRRSFLQSATEDESLPHWKKINWEDVRVGDFVKLVDNESFPADILICATSEDENMCYVETKNLDGETNLKSRSAVPELTHLRNAEACANREDAFRVDLDRPDSHMYKLDGAIETSAGKHPLDLQTVLLRGTVLRNTEWVIGVVLFTGLDTKIVLNAGGTPSKRSRVERQMNPQV